MRILRVAQHIYPETVGGGPYHVHALSRDQAAAGHDVTVVTVDGDEARPRHEARYGYSVVRKSPSARVLRNDLSIGIARHLWKAEGYDVLHAHSHLYNATNIAALMRLVDDTPLAITNHGLFSQAAPEWLIACYLRTLGRWTLNQADLIFCYTAEDVDRLRSLGVQSPVEVVPNGVDTDQFTPAGTGSEVVNHDGTVILFVGRLVEGKRPGEAIDAVARLPDRLEAKLYVIGDGPLRDRLENKAHCPTFLGEFPYDEMPGLYRSADVLVLPSRAEGFPRTILEAFASGVPVVASELEQTRSLVQSAGETVPVGDVEGLSRALERVVDESGELGKAGRQVVVDEFQWRDTVNRTTEALRSFTR